MDTRAQVITRSGGRCECMVSVGGRWTRCWRTPVEVHHMLTRARGGKILDAMGETNHLIALCHGHHKVAHSPGGHQAGLMMNGYITTAANGRVVYEGSDHRLAHLAVDVPALREDLSGDEHGATLRGQAP